MNANTFFHTTSDGIKLFVRRWSPESTAKALVLVSHGVGEHSGRYEGLASALTKAGYDVWVPDQRGHGKTAVSSGGYGWFAATDGFSRVVDDLKELRDRAGKELPGLPVFLLGHSMGSSVARAYISRYGDTLAGCALSGILSLPPLLQILGSLIVTLGRTMQGGRGIARFADKMTLGSYGNAYKPLRTPFDWLSRDPAVVDAYIADPECGFTCTWDFFRDMNAGTKQILEPVALAQIPKNLPVYIFAGETDPVGAAIGGVDKLAASYRAAGLGTVETRLYPGGRHEMLNETHREEVMNDLVAWLDSLRR
ncbi:MAG: alpha/beta hydrolase [Spirochaetia bacterium]|jgi:alpha-beta hydrolase superfamily lysophospholipase|nr:alpha/beta hydrolase [Spirochaetia bacterium]